MTFRTPHRSRPLLHRGPLRRALALSAIAAAALTGLTACDLFAPQDTKHIVEASVGVSARVGQVFVGNAVLVSSGHHTANLVVTLVNEATDAQQLEIVPAAGHHIAISLKPRGMRRLGDPPTDESLVTGLDAAPGALTTVTVTSSGQTVGLKVPVVSRALPPYGTLTPSPAPSPAPSPTPTATPSPTPSPTPSR
ncbi:MULTISPECIES: hypothetical protein [unclassified Leifsonia]|uniref:hypothetical protein n=1 Tax=unclassified Leifsonia TaxID=2663824 RepID=UPI0008A77442|nr:MULTISPECIES: hypothetical protein [unclassified Leifsonia]SEI04893.1 hypothetical protein SAMN04515694_11199 [Leifsonia sp. CL154]SFL75350.1 hypothetical protein SAMN04515692_11199 [Leifsonia sp. CL147]